jgi:hypothetical protein
VEKLAAERRERRLYEEEAAEELAAAEAEAGEEEAAEELAAAEAEAAEEEAANAKKEAIAASKPKIKEQQRKVQEEEDKMEPPLPLLLPPPDEYIQEMVTNVADARYFTTGGGSTQVTLQSLGMVAGELMLPELFILIGNWTICTSTEMLTAPNCFQEPWFLKDLSGAEHWQNNIRKLTTVFRIFIAILSRGFGQTFNKEQVDTWLEQPSAIDYGPGDMGRGLQALHKCLVDMSIYLAHTSRSIVYFVLYFLEHQRYLQAKQEKAKIVEREAVLRAENFDIRLLAQFQESKQKYHLNKMIWEYCESSFFQFFGILPPPEHAGPTSLASGPSGSNELAIFGTGASEDTALKENKDKDLSFNELCLKLFRFYEDKGANETAFIEYNNSKTINETTGPSSSSSSSKYPRSRGGADAKPPRRTTSSHASGYRITR